MGGIARQAAEDAAKRVGQVQTGSYAGPLGTVSFDPTTGVANVTPSGNQRFQQQTLGFAGNNLAAGVRQLEPGAQQFGQQAFDTSQQLLQQAGAFDPLGEAEKRFQRLQAALQPGRKEQQDVLQEQLFRQGRLDSGQGARLEAQQQAAFRLADVQALNDMYGQAQQAQQQAIQQGLQAGAAGTTAQQSQSALLGQTLSQQEQIAAQPFRIAGMLQDISANEVARRAAAAGALTQNNAVTGQVSGGGGAGAALGGLAGAAIGGYFGGPAGASTGATVGSNLGSFL